MLSLSTPDLLKRKDRVLNALANPTRWARITLEFCIVGVLGIAVFGALAVKQAPTILRYNELGPVTERATDLTTWDLIGRTVTVFWGPLLICLPALYVWTSIRGSKITFTELMSFAVAGLATIGIVLLSLTPIVWFFQWTSTANESLHGIQIAVSFISMLFGVYLVGRGLSTIHALRKTTEPESRTGNDVLLLWSFLLIAVTIQMMRTLGY
ncbi:MAG: hypothetical protein HY341_01750 [Candidatus Kerfeldbacteria bacterium]|nr:hypothetical protein [Candidatus Kerfeldbacteria bacterium]